MSEYPFLAVCLDDMGYLGSDAEGNAVEPGPEDRLDLLVSVGKVYKILGERLGMYVVVNNMGSTSLHPKSHFRETADA